MRSLISPVRFVSALSVPEVRMTLREMCGSAWDRSPFRGWVGENTFELRKNRSPFVVTRGIPRPVLSGTFAEQNGCTEVTVSVKLRPIELFAIILAALALAAGFVISGIQKGGFGGASSVCVFLIVEIAFLAVNYFMIWFSFQRLVAKLQAALGGVTQYRDD